MRRLVRAVVLIAALAGSPLAALAEPVFPNDGSVGMQPPEGMTPIPGVAGFEDRAAKAAIVVMEVPHGDFDTIVKTFNRETLQQQGVTVEGQREIALPDGGRGLVLTGYQSVGAVALKKWIMLAGGKSQTALVTAQLPEESSSRYSDAAIEATLASVVFRAPPTQEEMLARLPFTFQSLEGFKVMRVLGNSAVLLVKGEEAAPQEGRPIFIAGVVPGEVGESERESLAKRAIASVPGVRDLRVERGGPLRIGGQPGIEIVANAADLQTGKPMKVVQWLRFGRTNYIRMVGVLPADDFARDFDGLRALRDGLEPR
ncbi:hypothetical protein [Ancylobacter oerskovii]|uniref:Uncharacterized protein n=1 Tax=Ancylobacter oerskovii TaxID=459519 RepID=A0ABW4YU73_9HYPH|nr:hypothetical protein [Ancylobacter oerskovii]MBS7543592.1 hypothetical protein [Ancylobacter oerskovii]